MVLRQGAKREVLFCVVLAMLAWWSLGFGLTVRGDFSALDSLGPFRKAWAALGTPENPYALTPEERARVAVQT